MGVGWNFLFTGGTTLLTETYTPEEKAKVQGMNDFFIWGTISIGAVTSGAVQHSIGWDAVNLVMALLVVPCSDHTMVSFQRKQIVCRGLRRVR